MNSIERHIEAMDALAQQGRTRQQSFGEPGASAGPSAFSQGIGNLGGWAVFFGIMGAVLGGLLGRGLMDAIVGAVLCGGAMWALGAFGRASGGIPRSSVASWAPLGAAGGAVLGTMIGGADARHIVNAAINWGILGAILLGGVRLVRRART